MLREWEKLPKFMQTEEVRPYYDSLKKKKISLALKRGFDVFAASVMLVTFSPVLITISIMIVRDSKGGVFYRQERVTQYGRKFKIFKFRTMVANADKIGTQVTVSNDSRVTKIILGDMTLVGTRPESTHYVKKYTPEMFATLLLPAGVTSEASIKYKDEAELLDKADDVDKVYVEKVLPEKMKYNLESIRKFSFIHDIGTMIKTVFAVIR